MIGAPPRPPLLAAAATLALLAAGAAPVGAQDDAARALGLNERAVARFGDGDLEEALRLLREALALAPREPTIRHNTSRCLIAIGDRRFRARRFEDAARDYHEAVGLTPDDPAPALREALALHEALKDRDALAVLERVLNRWSDQAQAHDLAGRCRYRLGENARAIEHWERALALAPDLEGVRAALERARREEAVEEDLSVDLGAAHFTIKYDGERDLELGRQVGRVLEQAYEEVGRLLGRYPDTEVAVVIYPGRTFRGATGAHGWVAGLYDGKIRVPAAGLAGAPEHEVRRVLTHEYAHALLRAVGGRRVPAWLQEGFAQVAEGRSASDALRHVGRGEAPPLAQLTESFASEVEAARVRVRYATSCAFVHYLLGQGGAPLLADVLDRLGRNEPLPEAIRAVYGRTLDELYAAWRDTLPR